MKTLINIKTDPEVKKNAQKIANELGLSLSAVINASLKQFVRNREVYFSMIPKISPEFEKLLGNIERDIRLKKNLSKPFSSAKEAIVYLNS
jgi:addiction module RelB/DinJ family antitoxin